MARHNAKHKKRVQKLHRNTKEKPLKKTSRSALQAQYSSKIKLYLQMSPAFRLSAQELYHKCCGRRSPASYEAAVQQLLKDGEILKYRHHSYMLVDKQNAFKAQMVRLSGNFGFIRDENGTEYFVPGKYLLGSIVGDKVLAQKIVCHADSPEAEVISILEESENFRVAGTIIPTDEGLCLWSAIAPVPLHIDYHESCPYKVNDRVLCELTYRGQRHMEHRVKVILNFGNADCAENCMKSRIAAQNIPVAFPEKVLSESKKAAALGVTAFDMQDRLDLRQECIFTIDGASSKDMDDAISVKKHEKGWTLGVHIADVSHYVRPNSPLDAEAFKRGTSIYYANQVIPMLPEDLSNGICSLHPNQDRLTISAIIELTPEGHFLSAAFFHSVIHSKVRGIYSECNQILNHTADDALMQKYEPVTESLFLLSELTDKLEALRKYRGAPQLESTESALLLDDNGMCIGLEPVQRGRSECIIEACMLCANEAAARIAREKGFPLVYRVHEKPSAERISDLKEICIRLGLPASDLQLDHVQPSAIQQLLDTARTEPCFPVVNALTMRSMTKARYSAQPLGHFGLALKDYAHFTSPIRRYPDLVVHRILSDYLAKADTEWLHRRYAKFAENAAARSSDMEIRAAQLEREADACYAAEYMRAHIGEAFHGVITSITEFGMYVMLDNMAEGLLHLHTMPQSEYEIQAGWYIKDTLSGQCYSLGDAVEVICTAADVGAGHIDLALS